MTDTSMANNVLLVISDFDRGWIRTNAFLVIRNHLYNSNAFHVNASEGNSQNAPKQNLICTLLSSYHKNISHLIELLPYNIPDFFSDHETGNPKCTLPQRRRDAKLRSVALRNFATLRLRGEREFLKEFEWTNYYWPNTWLPMYFIKSFCKRRGLKS